MSKQDLLKLQSCILKVNIHCDGCEQKVKKLLQKIDGVYAVNIDAEEGKVLVAGNVDPAKLIKKLKRSGKHAEIWGGGQRGMMNNQNYPINQQVQNLQVADYIKGGKDNKQPQNHKGQKVGGVQGQLAHFQNVKGAQDLKVPSKEPKSVKFNLPEEEFYVSDDYGSDEFDDYGDDEEEEEEEGYGHSHLVQNKMMPVMGNDGGPYGPGGMMNGPAMNNNHKGKVGGVGNYGNGSDKKLDVMEIKGKGGNYNEAKNGNKVGKKSNEDLLVLGKNHKGEKEKRGGGGEIINKKKNGKSEGGLLGRFLGLGKKSKGGGGDTNKNKIEGGTNKGKGDKIGGGKLKDHTHSISNNNSMSENEFDFLDYDIPHDKNSKSGKGSNGKVNGNVGQMGINHSVNQMGNIPAVQGLPAMNGGGGGGGYYQGMHMQPPSHNNLQQQQYMAMMMNHEQQQQQANMYPQAMMYGRPHPSMNYMPPPPMPSHPRADPITHTFSDENVESCSIM